MSETGETTPSRLASARAARGLTPSQVAEQLRLTPQSVLAMEEGRYADLGPAVFARGHLRKYAALLGVPVAEVLDDYDSSPSRATESTLIPPASAHTPVRDHGGPQLTRAMVTVAGLVLVAAAAAAGWWYWQSRQSAAPAPVSHEMAFQAEATVGEVGAGGTDSVPAEVAEASPVDGLPAGEAGAGATDAGQDGAVASGRLALEFSGPCWVEVYSANGARRAFQLAEAGARFALDGPPPWRVVLGNADAVRVSLGGRDVPIPASMKVREAALVMISADGAVTPAPGGAEAR